MGLSAGLERLSLREELSTKGLELLGALGSLGNKGAVDNARELAVTARVREDHVIERLARRLAPFGLEDVADPRVAEVPADLSEGQVISLDSHRTPEPPEPLEHTREASMSRHPSAQMASAAGQ